MKHEQPTRPEARADYTVDPGAVAEALLRHADAPRIVSAPAGRRAPSLAAPEARPAG